MLRPGCLFGFHKRSKSKARPDGTRLVSVCKHCGVPMYRSTDARRRWHVIRD